jgi:hypothetical protein
MRLERTYVGKKPSRFQQIVPHVIIHRVVRVQDEDLLT